MSIDLIRKLLNIASPLSASEFALARLKARIGEYLSNHPGVELEQIDSDDEEGRFFFIAFFSNDEQFSEDYLPEPATRLLRVRVTDGVISTHADG